MVDLLIKLDIWVNVYVFKGNEGETISSRLGRKIEDKDCMWCRLFCRTILLPLAILLRNKDLKHCKDSISEGHR